MTQFIALHVPINSFSTGKIEFQFIKNKIIKKFVHFLSLEVSIQFQMYGQRDKLKMLWMPNPLLALKMNCILLVVVSIERWFGAIILAKKNGPNAEICSTKKRMDVSKQLHWMTRFML